MAILIRELDMPKNCADCPLYDDRWDYPTCYLTNSSRGYNFRIHELRMPDCPLVEIELDIKTFAIIQGLIQKGLLPADKLLKFIESEKKE